ncbi:MAG: hypothetical protein WD397_13010 [Wenzhouxiangellaceae bacterium]
MSLKIKRLQVVLVLGLFGIWPQIGVSALQLKLEAGSTTFGDFSLERIELRHEAGTTLALAGVSHATLGALGDLVVSCPQLQASQYCTTGRLTWSRVDQALLEFEFERSASASLLRAEGDTTIGYEWPRPGSRRLLLRDVPLAWIPPGMVQAAGFVGVSGSLSGEVDVEGEDVQATASLDDFEFDTPDGRFAGGGLGFTASLRWQPARGRLVLETAWNVGELLLGPAYLPPADNPLKVRLEADRLDDAGWRIEKLRLSRQAALALEAAGDLTLGDNPRIGALNIDIEHADLGVLWRQGLDSLAAAPGWAGLDPAGRLSGSVRIDSNALAGAGLQLSDASLDDDAGRLSLQGLGVWLGWDRTTESLELDAKWSAASLFRIPLGGSAFEFRSDEQGTLALTGSFRLPILDGALVLERFEWRNWMEKQRQLDLDARLEPIDLAALTRTLGWTEFGGRLSGQFPGIRLTGSVFDVRGGLEIDLFGGSARINHLSVERPFGSLPALAADIEFQALDLEQVTGAFEFGRMLGLASGHIKELRLLDWQPVRFDAWIETLEDSRERKISQKAVGSISSLSGGGSAALSGTLLRWFDDFPYRKAGLGCRLAANVCRMRGLRDVDEGNGYVILEGRLIPRLDIIGYQRRVDWPRLLAQLAAATGSGE